MLCYLVFLSCNREDLDNINLYWNELGCEGDVTLDKIVNARIQSGLLDNKPGIRFFVEVLSCGFAQKF